MEFEKPINETIKYGALASACVPMMSINRTAEDEKMSVPKYRMIEKISQFARLWNIKYQRGKAGQIFTEIKSGKWVWLKKPIQAVANMIKIPAMSDFIPAIYLNGLNKTEIIGYLF